MSMPLQMGQSGIFHLLEIYKAAEFREALAHVKLQDVVSFVEVANPFEPSKKYSHAEWPKGSSYEESPTPVKKQPFVSFEPKPILEPTFKPVVPTKKNPNLTPQLQPTITPQPTPQSAPQPTPQSAPQPTPQPTPQSALESKSPEPVKPLVVPKLPEVPKPLVPEVKKEQIKIGDVTTFLTRCRDAVESNNNSVVEEILQKSNGGCKPKILQGEEVVSQITRHFRACINSTRALQDESLLSTPKRYANALSELNAYDLLDLWNRESKFSPEFYATRPRQQNLLREVNTKANDARAFLSLLRKHARNIESVGSSYILITYQTNMIEQALQRIKKKHLRTFNHACTETFLRGTPLASDYKDRVRELAPYKEDNDDNLNAAIRQIFGSDTISGSVQYPQDEFNVEAFARTLQNPTVYDLCALLDYESVLLQNKKFEDAHNIVRNMLLTTANPSEEDIQILRDFAKNHSASAMSMFANQKNFKIAF